MISLGVVLFYLHHARRFTDKSTPLTKELECIPGSAPCFLRDPTPESRIKVQMNKLHGESSEWQK
jgi:hypothetical protein